MRILVVGGGKIGFYLTKALLEHGHIVSLIETDRNQSCFLANNLDVPVIVGDGTLVEVLERAGISQCDTVIAVTGQDEDNLVCCQLAKRLYNTKKTIVKVNNPKNAEAMKKLGIDIVVSSTDSIIFQLERQIDIGRVKELVQINEGEAAITEVSLPESYALDGTALSALNMPLGSNIVTITRNHKLIIPRGSTKLHSGDTLLIIVSNNARADVSAALKVDF